MSNDPIYSFSEYVKLKRQELGLTPGKAAARLGMTAQKLSDIEHGRRFCKRVSVSTLQQFARGYGLELAEIVRHTQQAVRNDANVKELLSLMRPSIMMAHTLATQLADLCETYPHELEVPAKGVLKYIEEIQAHFILLQNRHELKVMETDEVTVDPTLSDKVVIRNKR
jgi:transcriptional regulator with XRE-family HTH domain